MQLSLPISKRKLAARALMLSGIGSLLHRVKTWQGVLALNYHRVGDGSRSTFDRAQWSATPDAFDAQVRSLKKDFDIIGPGDLARVIARGHGRYVLITFDDGYRDNYEQAYPILKSHGVGATFFLATGYLDRPRPSWWDEIAWMVRTSPRRGVPARQYLPTLVTFDDPDRERAVWTLLKTYKSLPGEAAEAFLDELAEATGSGRCDPAHAARLWMTWDMVREMRAGGMWIGSHTAGHPVLARLPKERQALEIGESRRRIEEEISEPVTCFSYPVGRDWAFNRDTRACLEEQGIEFAFSYYGGYRRFDDWDPHDIRRVAVESDVDPSMFSLMLLAPWCG